VAIEHGSREKNEIALTFDADMTPRMQEELWSGAVAKWYDDRIVSTLEEGSVPATFFITGLWAENYPSVVRKLSETSLFEVANHSYDHGAFYNPCYKLPRAQGKIAEVTRTQEILTKITGKPPVFFRFPGGCASIMDLALVRLLGMRAIGWDVISGDAFSEDGENIVEHTVASTQNGSIIVMHLSGAPNAPMTAEVLPSLIKSLRDRGFSFVTMSRLIR
jgi:peptidoglycan/xylan/chitin deacetylase (PgdA/CDA1 family)